MYSNQSFCELWVVVVNDGNCGVCLSLIATLCDPCFYSVRISFLVSAVLFVMVVPAAVVAGGVVLVVLLDLVVVVPALALVFAFAIAIAAAVAIALALKWFFAQAFGSN